MELKQWTYEEFPAFSEEVEGAKILPTGGDEWIVSYTPNVEYADVDGHRLVLQILQPHSRNNPEPVLPCVVFVQGSAWMEQNVYAVVPPVAHLAEQSSGRRRSWISCRDLLRGVLERSESAESRMKRGSGCRNDTAAAFGDREGFSTPPESFDLKY